MIMKRLTLIAAVLAATTFSATAQDSLNLAMILPFKAQTAPNSQAFDFYSGALLAVREAAADSTKINLKVFDSADNHEFTYQELHDFDLAIGPFNSSAIHDLATKMPWRRYIISALDPACSEFADSMRVIQTPTPAFWQLHQLTAWAIEETQETDSLIVVKEPGQGNELLDIISAKLNEDEVPFTFSECNSYEDIKGILESHCSAEGVTRFILASEREEFAKRVLEVIAGIGSAKSVATYIPTKVRGFNSISTDIKAAAAVRIVAGYHIDENEPETRNFISDYKKNFSVSPNSFAFQGYDTARYFINVWKEYGEHWSKNLEDFRQKGLQTDFLFVKYTVGFINVAVRRTMFQSDGTVVRVK